MRSLIEEMLIDPELGDALRIDLAATLREIADGYIRRPPRSGPDPGSEQARRFGADQFDEVSEHMSHSQRLRQVLLTLEAADSDPAANLQVVEDLIPSIQLAQLSYALVLYVTSPEARADDSAIVRGLIEIADSLGTLQELAHNVSRDLELRPVEPHEYRRSVENLREATNQLTQSAKRYRNKVQQINEDRLIGDRAEARRSFFLNVGEMLDLGPRLADSEFDPSLHTAFGTAGDLLTHSFVSCRRSIEEHQGVPSPA